MKREVCSLPPHHGWVRITLKSNHTAGKHKKTADNGFTCQHCGAYVYTMTPISGVQNRNHCPFCLWSRHVDYAQPGDRMSACKAEMQPIGLAEKPGHDKYATYGKGELMLIHRCRDCGKLSINRLAADDLVEVIESIYRGSLTMDESTRKHLDLGNIHMLDAADEHTVSSQLFGLCCCR